jgi:sec-independent protein translocase protein TatC
MEQEKSRNNQVDGPDTVSPGEIKHSSAMDDHAVAGGEVKPFLEHLEDLRGVLFKSSLAVLICVVLCFFFTDDIIRIFKWPLVSIADRQDIGSHILRSLHPTDFLMASLKLVALTGAILAGPAVLYFIWEFVSPAMTPRERRISIPIFLAGLICFLSGLAFAYFVVLRMSLVFLWQYTADRGVLPEWTFDNYVSFVSAMMVAFGVVFEFPVIAALLAKFDLLAASTLKSKRRYAYLIMVILAAVLTPPDVVSQILLCLPMVAMYELSIGIVMLIGKRKK